MMQGTYTTPRGEEKVVMKRVKAKVEGAAELQEMELALNIYAAKAAKGHCADFIGYCTVAPEEATPSLTPGLWLVSCFSVVMMGQMILSDPLLLRSTL